MKTNEAISMRIIELMAERGWSAYKLATRSGTPHSTLSNVVLRKCDGCNLNTVVNVCRGVGIQLCEFFSSELFF